MESHLVALLFTVVGALVVAILVYFIKRGVSSADNKNDEQDRIISQILDRLAKMEKMIDSLRVAASHTQEKLETAVRELHRDLTTEVAGQLGDVDAAVLTVQKEVEDRIDKVSKDLSEVKSKFVERVLKCTTEKLTRDEFYRLRDQIASSLVEVNRRLEHISDHFQRMEISSIELANTVTQNILTRGNSAKK